jgi:integrase
LPGIRIDSVKIDGDHPFHEWSTPDQLQWLKTGSEPKSATDAPVRLFEAVARYLDHQQNQGKAFTTVDGYETELRAAKNYFGDIPLRDLTGIKLQEWINQLAKTPIETGRNRGRKPSPKSLSKKLKAFKRVVKWFHALGEPNLRPDAFDTATLPVKEASILDQLQKWADFDTRLEDIARLGIDPVSEGAFAEIIYTKEQLNEHIDALKQKLFIDGSPSDIRLYGAVVFCRATGCRRSELPRVRRQDLVLDETEPMVTLTKMKGRGHQPYLRQKMPLPRTIVSDLGRLLRVLPDGQQSLFVSDDAHLTANGFDESKVQAKASYLTDQIRTALMGTTWEHASGWHIYRHTLASRLLIEGYSQTEVKETIGWCSDEMVKRYQHLTHERKSAIINQIFA